MNVSGVIRGMMSKKFSGEEFILKVAQTMENQLNEWEKGYILFVLKLKDYEIWVKKNEAYIYHISILEKSARELQQESPFSLDAVLWRKLEEQGLEIRKGYGNYMDFIGW